MSILYPMREIWEEGGELGAELEDFVTRMDVAYGELFDYLQRRKPLNKPNE